MMKISFMQLFLLTVHINIILIAENPYIMSCTCSSHLSGILILFSSEYIIFGIYSALQRVMFRATMERRGSFVNFSVMYTLSIIIRFEIVVKT